MKHLATLFRQLENVTFVELPIVKTVPMLEAHLAMTFGAVKTCPVPYTNLVELAGFLTPLKTFPTRYGLLDFGTWTCLVNDMRGESCHVEGYALSRISGCRAIGVKIRLENRELHVYEGGEPVREIQSLLDGDRWYFRESGAFQWFEELSELTKKKKKEKLSVALLRTYFERYTGFQFPDWRALNTLRITGCERSLKDLKVPVIRFEDD